MSVPEAALEIRDYALSFRTPAGPFRVLDGIDLTIGRGEVVALVGESGSGKSTLAYAVMRSIGSAAAAERGSIRLGDEDLRTLPEGRLSRIRGDRVAMVFQDPGGSLNPTLPLGEHVVEVLARHRGLAPAAARAETRRLFEMVGLPDPDLMAEKYPHEVSGGEKQRVVIAMAFACDPDLILFDEATTALDATTAVNILDLFRGLQARTGVAALFISHDLGTVAEIAHRVAVIYGGRIVEDAAVDALFHQPRHPYTRALLACLPRPAEADRRATLFTLPGPLPDRVGPPRPCVFEARCPFVTDACRAGPVLLEGRGHRTACIRWREVLPLPLRDPGAATAAATAAPGPPVMTVRDLAVSIGRPTLLDRLLGREPRVVRAVTGVSFDLHPGRTLGLVGESGCGKSSLARALAGLRPFTGKVRFEERTISGPADMDRRYRGRVQIIFQNPDSSLNPRHTVATILSRPLRLHRGLSGRKLRAAVADLLGQVRLPSEHARRYPHQLSGGEKQRVAIARAIAAEPAVVICDEITSGLDASVQAAIVNLLRDIQARSDIAFLFITHDLNLLRYVADRVAVMYLGAFAEMRDGDGIASPPWHPYTEALLSSAPTLDPALEARRIRLSGRLPTRTDAILGCPFESRCLRRIDDRCALQKPPVRRFADGAGPGGHWLACHIRAPELAAMPPIWHAADDPTETGDTP